ncbi:uncharacterized protein [Narcine bancroftii]|uniref:uncharacterized protein n=1 Tax=Narcine bancroftii TaxID=1343680 RepID=UPI0038313325
MRVLLTEIDQMDYERERDRRERHIETMQRLMQEHRMGLQQAHQAENQGLARLITDIQQEMQAQIAVISRLASSIKVIGQVKPWPFTIQSLSTLGRPPASPAHQPPHYFNQSLPPDATCLFAYPSCCAPPSAASLLPFSYLLPTYTAFPFPWPSSVVHPAYIPTLINPSGEALSSPVGAEGVVDQAIIGLNLSSYIHLLIDEDENVE